MLESYFAHLTLKLERDTIIWLNLMFFLDSEIWLFTSKGINDAVTLCPPLILDDLEEDAKN
jgi:hypothetical protein